MMFCGIYLNECTYRHLDLVGASSQFLSSTSVTKSQREIRRVGKIGEFRAKSPFISETIRDRPTMVSGIINRKSYSQSIRVGSSDLKRWDVKGPFSPADLCIRTLI